MARLRELLAGLGHDGIGTYLQSGNAVFATRRSDRSALAAEIEDGIERQLGLAVTVLLRTAPELAEVVAANPFPAATAEPATLHVAFLSGPGDLNALDPARFAPDSCTSGDGAVYLHYPNGSARSKLTGAVLERGLGVRVTARN